MLGEAIDDSDVMIECDDGMMIALLEFVLSAFPQPPTKSWKRSGNRSPSTAATIITSTQADKHRGNARLRSNTRVQCASADGEAPRASRPQHCGSHECRLRSTTLRLPRSVPAHLIPQHQPRRFCHRGRRQQRLGHPICISVHFNGRLAP